MGDPVKTITKVAVGIATGGLSYIAEAGVKSVQQKSIMPLLTQGLDVGVAAFGNDLATEFGGNAGGIAFNLAGLGAGLAGGAGAFSSLPGFAPSAASPLVATPTGAIPLASGVTPTSAEIAGASLTGPVSGVTSAPAVVGGAPGGLANLAGLPGGVVASGAASVAVPEVASASTGHLAELTNAVPALNAAPSTAGWFSSLSPGAQTALITGGFAGANMITGGMQGLFQGVSAQKKLELEQLINAQHQNQIQYKNKNNTYAPLLTFRQPGLVDTPAL